MHLGETEPKLGAMVRRTLISDGRNGLRQFDSLAAEESASKRLLVLCVLIPIQEASWAALLEQE